MITRNTGSDALPLAAQPSYPGARLRALQNARSRREREASRPFDGDRLREDLRALEDPRNWTPGHDGDLGAELGRRGWTPDLLDAAQGEVRQDLSCRVRRSAASDPALTAGGGPGGGSGLPQSRPPSAVAQLRRDRLAAMRNINAARRAGDTWQLAAYVRQLQGRGADRPVVVDQGRRGPRTPRLAGSTTSGPNPRVPGGRGRRS